MPKEIKILLPDSASIEAYQIHVIKNDGTEILNYRYEIFDKEKDNLSSLSTADYLRRKIEEYDTDWEIAEIYAAENQRVPVLFKQILSKI